MNEILNIPVKSIYQIILTDKADKFLLDKKVVAFNESEAIRKAKIGAILKDANLERKNIQFFIKIIGHLYEGTFDGPLSEIVELTDTEKGQIK